MGGDPRRLIERDTELAIVDDAFVPLPGRGAAVAVAVDTGVKKSTIARGVCPGLQVLKR